MNNNLHSTDISRGKFDLPDKLDFQKFTYIALMVCVLLGYFFAISVIWALQAITGFVNW